MAAGVSSKEARLSIAASSMFPGFRFSPTDEELISYYLHNKMNGLQQTVEVIPEIEIWKYEPWELPGKSVIPSESEWFFFSPRGRKYPNGSQSRRATELGYWKATGKERNVKSGSDFIGTKRTLVFHIGRAPKGERTEWIMHEYCKLDKSQDFMVVCRLRKNSEFRLNDGTNQGSSSQRHLSTTDASNCAVSEVGTNQQDNAAEFNSKKCSSSYDSYSIEQIDSASESNLKPASEVTQPECSGQQKVCDDEEDFFADILKDDIIKLDETSISSTLLDNRHWVDETSLSAALDLGPFATIEPEDEHKPSPVDVGVSQALPLQGIANRRIRLSMEAAWQRCSEMEMETGTNNDQCVDEVPRENSESTPKCIAGFSLPRLSPHRYFILFMLLLLLSFMVLFMGLLGDFWRIKRVMYNLYQSFLG